MADGLRDGGDTSRESPALTVNKKASELSPGGSAELKSPTRPFPYATEDETFARVTYDKDGKAILHELPDGLATDGSHAINMPSDPERVKDGKADKK